MFLKLGLFSQISVQRTAFSVQVSVFSVVHLQSSIIHRFFVFCILSTVFYVPLCYILYRHNVLLFNKTFRNFDIFCKYFAIIEFVMLVWYDNKAAIAKGIYYGRHLRRKVGRALARAEHLIIWQIIGGQNSTAVTIFTLFTYTCRLFLTSDDHRYKKDEIYLFQP